MVTTKIHVTSQMNFIHIFQLRAALLLRQALVRRNDESQCPPSFMDGHRGGSAYYAGFGFVILLFNIRS
jgi:hypothetical protein